MMAATLLPATGQPPGGSDVDANRLEVLRRLADEGLRHAGEGLSEMTGSPISTAVPRVDRLPIAQIAQLDAGPDEVVAGIYLAIGGDVAGHMLLLLPLRDAMEMTDMLLEQPPGTTVELDDLACSALGEVGNLTCSFFLTSLADATGMRLYPSPPATVIDMGGAILDSLLADISVEADEALAVETIFTQNDRKVNLLFLVLLRPHYLEIVLGHLPQC